VGKPTQVKIRVILVDDHTLVRKGLARLLSLNEQVEVLAEVGDGREGVKVTLELRPDVVLMDLAMPNYSGFEAIRQIKRQLPSAKILVLSAHDNEEYVQQTVFGGADGYLLKNTSPEEMSNALRSVFLGQSYFSPSVAQFAENAIAKKSSGFLRITEGSLNSLTAREREILQLIAESHSHQDIADLLHISVRTVDTHRFNIIQKLGLHDTASLVTYAIKNGVVILRK
jgi:two-component system, NarL family, response regulator NreC